MFSTQIKDTCLIRLGVGGSAEPHTCITYISGRKTPVDSGHGSENKCTFERVGKWVNLVGREREGGGGTLV